VRADRELPVVWAVAKGSMVNKAILVPAALAISALVPWLITPLLMAGGAFLCFEGTEKLLHKLFHSKSEEATHHGEMISAMGDEAVDVVAFEKEKIKGAVRTDFVLSAEIIVISLGTVAAASFAQRVLVLVGISILMTLGVYGLVAGIVKLDDLGLHLNRQASGVLRALGRGILSLAPWLMKTLSVLGTAAMFLVGGGILVHGVPALHHGVGALAGVFASGPLGGLWQGLSAALLNALLGVVAGAAVVGLLALMRTSRGGR